jgi:hypothetical protein
MMVVSPSCCKLEYLISHSFPQGNDLIVISDIASSRAYNYRRAMPDAAARTRGSDMR